MSETKVNMGDIRARVGDTFDVTLYSRPGSTGFSWMLAYMPSGVVLLDTRTDAVPPVMPGSQSRQVFTFIATGEVSDHLSFQLLRPWTPTEPADSRTYALFVGPTPKLQEALETTAGAGSFAPTQAYRSHLPPIMPYGFPDPEEMRLDKVPVYPLYGFPVRRSAGVGQMHTVVESSENCVVKYGFPWGLAVDEEQCVLKYGFPVGHQRDEHGVIPLYAFPVEPGATNAVAVRQDDANCVVKYGTPQGVATSQENCTLMYGVPVPRAEG